LCGLFDPATRRAMCYTSAAMTRRTRYFLLPFICAGLISGCNFPSRPVISTPTSAPDTLAMTLALTPTPEASASLPATEVLPTVNPNPRLGESPELISTLPDVHLEVTLHYVDHWMGVHQTVSLINTSSDAWDEVVFNIPINAIPDAFYLDFAHVTVEDDLLDGVPALPALETILRFPLPLPAKPGESIQIDMDYRVLIPPIASTDWPPRGTTGWRFELIQAGEWYPALVPYVDGEGWHTWEHRPVGDPTVYPLVNYTLNVSAENDITVVSSGAQGQDANGVWRFEMDAARGIAYFASTNFVTSTGEANGIPITSVYRSEHAAAGEAALQIASESLSLYEELYGTYPYPSLVVVENGFFGGMEYSGLVSISDYGYSTYVGDPRSVLHALVSHEIAHQWWYGAVGNDQANEPWLDEGLAFYSELLYYERYHPENIDWWWQYRVDVYEPYGPVDATIYTYDVSASFITSMYGQAARFMRDLRREMGDEAFFNFLREYYTTYSGKMVTGRDFKIMAQSHTDQDLRSLFERYFANPDPD
jgi:hypothetical protein